MKAAHAAVRGKTFARRRAPSSPALLATATVLAGGAPRGRVVRAIGRAVHARAPATARSVSLRPDALNLVDARTRRVVGRVAIRTQRIRDRGTWRSRAGPRGSPRRSSRSSRAATRRVTGTLRSLDPGPPGGGDNSCGSSGTADGRCCGSTFGPERSRPAWRIRGDLGGSEGRRGLCGRVALARLGAEVVRVAPRSGRVSHRFRPRRDSSSSLTEDVGGRPGMAKWKIDPVTDRIVRPDAPRLAQRPHRRRRLGLGANRAGRSRVPAERGGFERAG